MIYHPSPCSHISCICIYLFSYNISFLLTGIFHIFNGSSSSDVFTKRKRSKKIKLSKDDNTAVANVPPAPKKKEAGMTSSPYRFKINKQTKLLYDVHPT